MVMNFNIPPDQKSVHRELPAQSILRSPEAITAQRATDAAEMAKFLNKETSSPEVSETVSSTTPNDEQTYEEAYRMWIAARNARLARELACSNATKASLLAGDLVLPKLSDFAPKPLKDDASSKSVPVAKEVGVGRIPVWSIEGHYKKAA